MCLMAGTEGALVKWQTVMSCKILILKQKLQILRLKRKPMKMTLLCMFIPHTKHKIETGLQFNLHAGRESPITKSVHVDI